MDYRTGKHARFTYDEIGTIAVNQIRRAMEIDDKRKRKVAFNSIARLLPKVESIAADAEYRLEGVSMGIDPNGELIVIAVYSLYKIVETGQ